MINTAVIMGRLTAAPELRQTQSGISVARFSVAVERPYSKSGERQTDFLDVVAWRNTADFVCRYFVKGQMIAISGSIQARTYTEGMGTGASPWKSSLTAFLSAETSRSARRRPMMLSL